MDYLIIVGCVAGYLPVGIGLGKLMSRFVKHDEDLGFLVLFWPVFVIVGVPVLLACGIVAAWGPSMFALGYISKRMGNPELDWPTAWRAYCRRREHPFVDDMR